MTVICEQIEHDVNTALSTQQRYDFAVTISAISELLRSLSIAGSACTHKCAFYTHLERDQTRISFPLKRKKNLFSSKMAFGDVKTPEGLEELNKFLAEHSYIEG